MSSIIKSLKTNLLKLFRVKINYYLGIENVSIWKNLNEKISIKKFFLIRIIY
jgi:hypothetical protein